MFTESEAADRSAGLDLALATLAEGDFRDRWEAAKRLVAIGPVAIGPLLDLLASEAADPDVCWFIVRILADLGDPLVIDRLIGLAIADHEEAVRSAAALALAKLASESLSHRTVALAALSQLLNEPGLASAALTAIAQIQQPEAIPYLLAGLQAADPAARRSALEGLAAWRDRAVALAAIEPVGLALGDAAEIVRREAAIALGSLIGLLAQNLADDQLPITAAIATLSQALHDSPTVAEQAALSLGRIIKRLPEEAAERAIAGLLMALDEPTLQPKTAATITRILVSEAGPVGWRIITNRWPQLPVAAQLAAARSLMAVARPGLDEAGRDLLVLAIAQTPGPIDDRHLALAGAAAQLQAIDLFEPLAAWLPLCLGSQADRARLHLVTALRAIDPDRGRDRLQTWADQEPDRDKATAWSAAITLWT